MRILRITWEVLVRCLIVASVLANFISVILFLFLFKIGDDLIHAKDLPLSFIKKIGSKNLENVVDSISYASQLGRLDIVSFLLAIFAMILGIGAVAGFLHIKESSNGIAKNEAEKWLDENFQKVIKGYIRNDPDFAKFVKKEVSKSYAESAEEIPDSLVKEITKSRNSGVKMSDSSAEEIAKSIAKSYE